MTTILTQLCDVLQLNLLTKHDATYMYIISSHKAFVMPFTLEYMKYIQGIVVEGDGIRLRFSIHHWINIVNY